MVASRFMEGWRSFAGLKPHNIKMEAFMVGCRKLYCIVPYLWCLFRWTLTVEMASMGWSVESVLLRVLFRWRRVFYRKIPLISLEAHVLSQEKAVMIMKESLSRIR